jgi:hypothetical protein
MMLTLSTGEAASGTHCKILAAGTNQKTVVERAALAGTKDLQNPLGWAMV